MTDNPTYNEQEIIARIAEGDEAAFYTLFKKYTPLLRPFVWKYTGSEIDTEEIIQETFIRIWLYRDRLPEVANLRAWIYKVAARVYLVYIRKAMNERNKEHRHLTQHSVDADHFTPLDILQVEEMTRTINAAVKQLSEQRRRIYRMSREEGMKPADIAAELGMPVGTVKNHLSAALKEIRDHLKAEGHGSLAVLCLIVKIF